MPVSRFKYSAALIFLLLILPAAASAGTGQAAREALSEASKQWLEEIVPYIITPAERQVFLSLSTEAERGQFIDLFWKKRNPDPDAAENEYKRQYYLRITLADRFFGVSGIAGWRTDRGRIFILLGAPHEIQTEYNQTDSAGLNRADREIWQYWGLPNPKLPYNMEFVFVDRYGHGNYVLESGHEPGKRDRNLDMRDLTFQFDSLELLAEAQRNPFENLKKATPSVTTEATANLIPFDFRLYAFRGAEEKTHLPLLLEIPYAALPSKPAGGKEEYSLNIIAHVRNQLGQDVLQKTKTVSFGLEPAQKAALQGEVLRFQTSLDLDPGSYGLELVVWDNVSGRMGTSLRAFTADDFKAPALAASDVFLSSGTGEAVDGGTAAVTPGRTAAPAAAIARRTFRDGDEMDIALEAYHLALDKETGRSSLQVEFAFLQQTQPVLNVPAYEPEPTTERDCRIKTSFRLRGFRPGEYILRVKVTDRAAGASVTKDASFRIIR